MTGYNLAHLDDATLLRQLSALIAGKRAATAVLLAHIAEVDARRLYLPAAYPSMYSYCVGALRLAENAAYRHVRSARVARRFPRLFDDVATGRLHLTATSALAPHLREENLNELVAAASDRSRLQLDAWLARRFPAQGPMLPAAQVRAVGVVTRTLPAAEHGELPLAEPLEEKQPNRLASMRVNWADRPVPMTAGRPLGPAVSTAATPPQPDGPPEPDGPPPPVHPYFLLKVALDEATHAKLERAQVLLAHSVRAGEVAEVLDRALDALLSKLEKRRGAAEPRPQSARDAAREPAPEAACHRPPRTERTDGRGIPAAVRREVWARDGGRCTFMSSAGRQCGADRGLEFDHVQPVARGGAATAANLRIRCRAHNQLEAERTFGEEFMRLRRTKGRPEASTRGETTGGETTGGESAGEKPPPPRS